MTPVKRAISAITQTSLDLVKTMVFERFMGGGLLSFVALLSERFWVCLESHATTPFARTRSGAARSLKAEHANRLDFTLDDFTADQRKAPSREAINDNRRQYTHTETTLNNETRKEEGVVESLQNVTSERKIGPSQSLDWVWLEEGMQR